MARNTEEAPAAPTCHFDPTAILDALAQITGQLEDLRAGLATVDQKITQHRSLDHQNLLQTVKQVRGALDLATRDNKRQLEFLGTQVVDATTRIRSLDLALSNRKLEELAARVRRSATGSSKKLEDKEVARVEQRPAS